MAKINVTQCNSFFPQPLVLYGTNKADGTPNFGLFSWFSYYWDTELKVIASIGGGKLTRDRIRAEGKFSANLVTQRLLPLADYLGNNDGYAAQKMDVPLNVARGAVLDVPVLTDSAFVFELEVERSLTHDDGEVFFCRIRNGLADEEIFDESIPLEKRMQMVSPALYFGLPQYGAVAPELVAACGTWKNLRTHE